MYDERKANQLSNVKLGNMIDVSISYRNGFLHFVTENRLSHTSYNS